MPAMPTGTSTTEPILSPTAAAGLSVIEAPHRTTVTIRP